jgi:hypothetical protein
MAGPDAEDDDETLIADEDEDEGETLVDPLPDEDEEEDETLVASPLVRLALRGPLPVDDTALTPVRRPASRVGGRPPPRPSPPLRPVALPEIPLDKRALPFAVGAQAPLVSDPRMRAALVPATRTQELPNVVPAPVAPAPPRPVPPPSTAPEHAIVPAPEGMPPFVVRFLLVCGVLTALGLMALIYLEL